MNRFHNHLNIVLQETYDHLINETANHFGIKEDDYKAQTITFDHRFTNIVKQS